MMFILVMGNSPVHAQDALSDEPQPRYQVEVIVLRHLQSDEPPALVDQINDYRQFETVQTLLREQRIYAQDSRSETMAGVWNRLRSSAGYRPLLYRGWIQYATPMTEPLPARLHGDTVFETTAEPGIGGAADPHFRLEGFISFSKGRFYHIKLGLEWRESAASDIAPHPDLEALKYQVYALRQQRQILLDAVTYFDTPWLGALVRVSELEEQAGPITGE